MGSNISLLKLLDNRVNKGQIGLIVGERGSGKSACLISVGVERILKGSMILHVSLEELPERIANHYELKITEALKLIKNKHKTFYSTQRVILSYLNQSFDIDRLNSSILDLKENFGSEFDLMLIDGLETDNIEVLQGIEKISKDHNIETWISYSLNNYLKNKDRLEDICEAILWLYSNHDNAYILLIKGKKKNNKDKKLELNPVTFFVK